MLITELCHRAREGPRGRSDSWLGIDGDDPNATGLKPVRHGTSRTGFPADRQAFRDTAVPSAPDALQQLERFLHPEGHGTITHICGS